MVRYNPLVAFLRSILTAQRAKQNLHTSLFRRTRVKLLYPFSLPPPLLPIWLSRPLDSLRGRYPEDRFHILVEVYAIDDPDGCIGTVDRDFPNPPAKKLESRSYMSCEDCREEVAIRPWNQADMERFEVHLQTRTHRQLVKARRSGYPSIIPKRSVPTHIPMLKPSSESDTRDSLGGGAVVPYKDPNPHFLPRSSSSPVLLEPPPDERMVDYPPDRIYPEKMEADIDGLAGGNSCSDSKVSDISEEKGFWHVSLGRERLDLVKKNRKRNAPSSSEGAGSCGRERARKRRRGRR
jgi:hypothetical protein